VLRLPAQLNIAQARAALDALAGEAVSGQGPLVVDASALADFDSAAIATLIELRRRARAKGRGFSVSGAPTAMVELAALYGVADLLAFEPATSPRQSARA
jgi:phospholipid transport system transporter-binding protein